MKTVSIISFTRSGAKLSKVLQAGLNGQGMQISCFTIPRLAEETGLPGYAGSLQDWAGKQFDTADGLIFLSACGIAVRAIAPFVRDKLTDPAVVVIDEQGCYAVSLLSGHMGDANDLTRRAARLTGAVPVISTATDLNRRFAVDSWAKEQGLVLTDRKTAKDISASLLENRLVGFSSDFPVSGELPDGLSQTEETQCGILVTVSTGHCPFTQTLRLVPQIVTLGIGCKKGIPVDVLERQVLEVLKTQRLSLDSLKQVCSISLKGEEPALLAFCEKYRLPFQTYSAGELMEAPGQFTASEFVHSITGVDNVCERAAVLGSGGGTLLFPKQAGQGVTVAASAGQCTLQFNHME